MFLDVRNHCFRAGNFLSDFPSKQFLQFLDRSASFAAESVEVHERSDSVEALTQCDHDKHGRLGQTSDLDVSQGAETFDVDGFHQIRHRLVLPSKRLLGKVVLPVLLLETACQGEKDKKMS